METKASITRNNYSNPFHCNGKELFCICFFKDSRIIASTRWFESNNLWERVDFPFEIRKARKINLEKTDAFVNPYTDETYKPWDRMYALYIHADLVGLEFSETKDCGVSLLSHHTCDIYKLKLNGLRASYRYNKETKVCDRTLNEVTDYEQTFDCNHKFEDTDDAGRCEELAKKINELTYLKLTKYDVDKLLQHFDISEKKKK